MAKKQTLAKLQLDANIGTELVETSNVDTELVEVKEVVHPIKTSSGKMYVPQGIKVQIRQKLTGKIIAMSVEKTFAESLCKKNPNIEIV